MSRKVKLLIEGGVGEDRPFITADDFARALVNSEGDEIFQGKRVRGTVHLRGQVIQAPIRAFRTHFEGEVDLSECSFASGLDFTGCTFSRTLSLRNSKVDGDLVLDDATIRDRPASWGVRLADVLALDLRGTVVEGNLVLQRTAIAGPVNGSLLRVGGSVRILGTEIDGSLSLVSAKIDGHLELLAWLSDPPTRLTNPTAQSYRLSAVQGAIACENIRIAGNLFVQALQAADGFSMWCGTVEGYTVFEPLSAYQNTQSSPTKAVSRTVARTHIIGDLHLGSCSFKSFVRLADITITGALLLFSIRCTGLRIESDTRIGNEVSGPPSLGHLNMDGAMVRGDVTINPIIVDGTRSFRNIRGASLSNMTVEGHMRFWLVSGLKTDSPDNVLLTDPLHEGAHVDGDLLLNNIQIWGDLDVTNAFVAGDILLTDAHVKGDIAFRSAPTMLDSRDLDQGIRDRIGNGEGTAGSFATALDLSSTHCERNVDLTGLALGGSTKCATGSPRPGCLAAQRLRVGGRLMLYAGKPGRNGGAIAKAFTRIPGALDLSDADVNTLVLSAHAHGNLQLEEARDDDSGIVLAGMKIGELQVISVDPPAGRLVTRPHLWLPGRRIPLRVQEVFPRPLDLRDIQVGVWSLGKDEVNRVERFRAFLDGDRTFRRDTYIQVEAMLRNGGHQDDADAIYVEMRIRANRQQWKDAGGLRRVGLALWNGTAGLFYRHLMRFGTTPVRLLMVILVAWIVALPVYYERGNYEPSLAYRQTRDIDPDRVETMHPDPITWRGATPFFASIPVHVPVISMAVRDEWELRDSGRTCYALGWAWPFESQEQQDKSLLCAGPLLRMTPEDWKILMVVINLILWPLVLTYLLRKLLH